VVVAALMTAQAAIAIALPGLYRDEDWALEAWRLNDIVTLALAVPLLVVALLWARRGSMRATLVWFGVLQYGLYNYAFYLFGAALNAFFLLYVALFVSSTLALILGFVGLDAGRVRGSVGERMPVRIVTGYLVFWAAALGFAWAGQWLGFVMAGRVPEIGEEPFRLIAALDLSLVVSPLVIASWLLWRRNVWGFILAVVLLVKGVLYSLLLSAASLPLIDGEWGGDPFLPLWLVLAAGAIASLAALLAHLRSR
jgi:hypothetical protein